MTAKTIGTTKDVLAISAFGFEIRLWQETTEVEWCATIHDGGQEVSCCFEEDNLALAKLHILAEARNRALVRSGRDRELPPYETLLDSWEPMI